MLVYKRKRPSVLLLKQYLVLLYSLAFLYILLSRENSSLPRGDYSNLSLSKFLFEQIFLERFRCNWILLEKIFLPRQEICSSMRFFFLEYAPQQNIPSSTRYFFLDKRYAPRQNILSLTRYFFLNKMCPCCVYKFTLKICTPQKAQSDAYY
ncbi:hypothetical protein RchiOBHm_Chr2g0118051 [Rosa chinensis]|uniref:Uncharacterized protein n=1 Tax=Rosa chinensis TaxID=74649 RepID=A0A2P6RRT2_ROSCH|nr:hypothetical protein RchiOBHm_Chr2g0118051 [Rosa chinensis]